MDSNFRAFWLALVTWSILGYSLFCERREKWRVVSRKFQKKKLKQHFFYPCDLVNTKTTIPLRVGEERWIYTSTLRVSVYIHHYSPPLRGTVVYLYPSTIYYYLFNAITMRLPRLTWSSQVLTLCKQQRMKTWKIRAWIGSEPWPLRCRCSAQWVDLSGQLGPACHWVNYKPLDDGDM